MRPVICPETSPGFRLSPVWIFARAVILLPLLFTVSSAALAQRPGTASTTPAANPGDVSIGDVCAAAVPRESQGKQFQWSPDGSGIAYFKSVEKGFGLRLELDTVSAAGTDRAILLNEQQIDKLFPAKNTGGDEETAGAVPRAKVGFEWHPDGSGLLLHSDVDIVWLDRKTLKTRSLVTGKEQIGDVQLSPDGRSAAFVRDHNLWIVNIATGTARPVTKGGNHALLKGELDWLYPEELGTRHGYAWSPDSSHIAYIEFNLKGVPRYTPPFTGDDDDDSSPGIDYPTPGSHNPAVRVLVTGLDGKLPPVAINTGAEKDIYLPRLQWLPDSKHVAVQRLNRPQDHLDLLIADSRNGVSRVVLSESDPYWINLTDTLYFLTSAPQFIWSSERSGFRHLYLYGLDGKLVSQLTDGKWEVTSLDAVNERDRKFYYTSTEVSELERQLYVADLDGKSERRISNESGTHEAVFAPGSATYVDNFSTAIKPWARAIYKVKPQTAEAGQTSPGARSTSIKVSALEETPPGSAGKLAFRPVDFLTVKTHDGVDLNALLIRPAHLASEKKYPSVVYIYGGPGQQTVRDAWDGAPSMWRQMLAQRGYVVFAVDNRGTSGRGHAFEEYIHLRFEGQEVIDQKDAVRFLQSLPYIDPARVGIWGQGFGGALTINTMLHPPLLFKAGFAIAPIVNWQKYDSAFTERYLGDPIKNQDGYLSSSPLDEWQRYTGPMLVGQGMADLAVHPDQTMELQADLVEKRRYVETAFFPGQPHAIDGADACTVLYQRATDFFIRSLGSAEAATAPAQTPPVATSK